MTKSKSKPKPTSRANDRKTKTRNTVTRTTAHKALQLKPDPKPAVHSDRGPRRSRLHGAKANRLSSLQCCERQMARAANWQPHSVRGFLAGVVRKKLGLTLVSADGKNGRVYQISDRAASAA